MKLVHVIDLTNNILLDVYFVDEKTGLRIDYSIEELFEDIRR